MNAFVVDTNVAVVANGNAAQANPECVIACIDTLLRVRDAGGIVLDDSMRVLKEYMGHLSLSGQPGAGDLFMKWVWSVQADDARCERVHITPKPQDPDDFVEFPDDDELDDFDPSDRKFVAIAAASAHAPPILNAVDSDWADAHAALARHGIDVIFLCPQHVSP